MGVAGALKTNALEDQRPLLLDHLPTDILAKVGDHLTRRDLTKFYTCAIMTELSSTEREKFGAALTDKIAARYLAVRDALTPEQLKGRYRKSQTAIDAPSSDAPSSQKPASSTAPNKNATAGFHSQALRKFYELLFIAASDDAAKHASAAAGFLLNHGAAKNSVEQHALYLSAIEAYENDQKALSVLAGQITLLSPRYYKGVFQEFLSRANSSELLVPLAAHIPRIYHYEGNNDEERKAQGIILDACVEDFLKKDPSLATRSALITAVSGMPQRINTTYTRIAQRTHNPELLVRILHELENFPQSTKNNAFPLILERSQHPLVVSSILERLLQIDDDTAKTVLLDIAHGAAESQIQHKVLALIAAGKLGEQSTETMIRMASNVSDDSVFVALLETADRLQKNSHVPGEKSYAEVFTEVENRSSSPAVLRRLFLTTESLTGQPVIEAFKRMQQEKKAYSSKNGLASCIALLPPVTNYEEFLYLRDCVPDGAEEAALELIERLALLQMPEPKRMTEYYSLLTKLKSTRSLKLFLERVPKKMFYRESSTSLPFEGFLRHWENTLFEKIAAAPDSNNDPEIAEKLIRHLCHDEKTMSLEKFFRVYETFPGDEAQDQILENWENMNWKNSEYGSILKRILSDYDPGSGFLQASEVLPLKHAGNDSTYAKSDDYFSFNVEVFRVLAQAHNQKPRIKTGNDLARTREDLLERFSGNALKIREELKTIPIEYPENPVRPGFAQRALRDFASYVTGAADDFMEIGASLRQARTALFRAD